MIYNAVLDTKTRAIRFTDTAASGQNDIYSSVVRIHTDINLSSLAVIVNFRNAAKQYYRSYVVDKFEEEDGYYFDWPIDFAATAFNGPLLFTVMFEMTDGQDNVVYRFSSRETTLDVFRTINPDIEEPTDEELNTIQQLIQQLNSLINSMQTYVYSGTSDPDNSLGDNNSVYLKVNGSSMVAAYGKVNGVWSMFPTESVQEPEPGIRAVIDSNQGYAIGLNADISEVIYDS